MVEVKAVLVYLQSIVSLFTVVECVFNVTAACMFTVTPVCVCTVTTVYFKWIRVTTFCV